MSKIYEALRRHGGNKSNRDSHEAVGAISASPSAMTLELILQSVYRLGENSKRGVLIQFVAATVGEGVTTLSRGFAELAANASADKGRVLLVDADRQRLSMARAFGCASEYGLIDLFQKGAPADNKVVEIGSNNLEVSPLFGSRSPPGSRKAIEALYDQLRDRHDIIVMDCPPALSENYFELSPNSADGIILIVQAEKNRPAIVRQAHTLVRQADGKLLGAVLNRHHRYIPEFLYNLL